MLTPTQLVEFCYPLDLLGRWLKPSARSMRRERAQNAIRIMADEGYCIIEDVDGDWRLLPLKRRRFASWTWRSGLDSPAREISGEIWTLSVPILAVRGVCDRPIGAQKQFRRPSTAPFSAQPCRGDRIPKRGKNDDLWRTLRLLTRL